MESAVKSVYVGKADYIVSTFSREKSKFINETIEFNLRSSYSITECVEEEGEFKIIQKRFYKNCPLPIKTTDVTSIHVESRCEPVGNYENYQINQSGIYIPFSTFNNRTIYRKSKPDRNRRSWFLYKTVVSNSWQLYPQFSPDTVFAKTRTCVFEQNQGTIFL